MKEEIKFEFYKGRTYIRFFSIENWTPSIDKMYFTVKENVNNKNYIMQKNFDNGIECTDIYTTEEGKKGREYSLTLNATDTDRLEINKNYVFDIAIISKDIKQTATTGILRLLGTATHTHNEKV